MTTSGTDLTGKVALVTGGSRGLGREMVRAFATAGADVVVSSRNLDSCELLAAEVRETTGRKALAVACHAGDWDALANLADASFGEFGRVDILVNNAGLSPAYPSLDSVDRDLWDKIFAVNVGGPFRLTTLVAPRMVDAGGGSIINVSSVGSIRPRPSHLPYAAAKAGLNVLTQGFAQEYGPLVRVNTVMAGPFSTEMTRGWDPEATKRRVSAYPLQRVGDPHEIVGAALYFAGDQSSFTTGTVLTVDGGMAVS